MMRRIATAQITEVLPERQRVFNLRTASTAPKDIEIDPDKLYIVVTALHWDMTKPATPAERKLYGVDQAYCSNDNGDAFEGGRNLVWSCKACKKQFLKYPEKDTCPHCRSASIHDYEFDVFGRVGELLTRNASNRWVYESWRGCPVHENHNESVTLGQIEDVWPVIKEAALDELLSINKKENSRIASRIAGGQIKDTSMGVLVGVSLCSNCFNIATDEEHWCDCLNRFKGKIHPRTGMRVFEINKNLQGAEHSIITIGSGADSAAKTKLVLAAVEDTPLSSEQQEDTMADSQGRTLRKKVTDSIAARSAAGPSAGGGHSSRAIITPAMRQQLLEKGYIDSTQLGEAIGQGATKEALTASILQQIKQLESVDPVAAKQMRTAMNQSSGKAFTEETLFTAVASICKGNKITPKEVVAVLSDLTADPTRSALLIDRIQHKKETHIAQLMESDLVHDLGPVQIESAVVDAITDALVQKAKELGQSLSDVADETVTGIIEKLTQTHLDKQETERSIEEHIPNTEHVEEHKEIPTEEIHEVVTAVEPSEEKEQMNKTADVNQKPLQDKANFKTESGPPEASGKEQTSNSGPVASATTESHPEAKKDSTQECKNIIAASEADIKAPAAPVKMKTEEFPEAKGEIDVEPLGKTSAPKTEDFPDVGTKAAGSEVDMKKDTPALQKGSHESFPSASTAEVKSGDQTAKPKPEDHPGSKVAQVKTPDEGSLKGESGKTPVDTKNPPENRPDLSDKTGTSEERPDSRSLKDKSGETKADSGQILNEGVGGDTESRANEVDFPNEGVGGEAATPARDTHPDALVTAKLKVAFFEDSRPGKRSASFWQITADEKPMFRISARAAWGDEVIDKWDLFSSPQYGDALRTEARRLGLKGLNSEWFGDKGEIITAKTAQTAPGGGPGIAAAGPPGPPPSPETAPAAQPANLNQDAAAGLSESTPSSPPITVVLSKAVAPYVANNPIYTVQTFVQAIVQAMQDQDQVTEFTLKLEDEVGQLNPQEKKEEPASNSPPQLVQTPGATTQPMQMVGASKKKTAAGDEVKDEAYYKEAYPEGYGAEYNAEVAKTEDPKARVAQLEKELAHMRKERTARLRYEQASELAKRAQIAGLIPGYSKFKVRMSRAGAKVAAQNEREAEVKRLLVLDDAGFEHTQRLIDAAFKQHAETQPKVNPFEGHKIMGSLPASESDADIQTNPGREKTLGGATFASAVDVDKVEAANKEGATRPGRK